MKNQQETYQQYLVDCISNQCSKTKAHINYYRRHYANNRHSAGFTATLKQLTFALTVERAEDAFVYDLDGNKYLDISCGFGVHLFGHSPKFIKDAIVQQMEKGSSLGPVFDTASEVARMICTMTSNDRCAFFNSGTEAIMVATRLARAATGKNRIVIFEGSYHGTLDSLLVMKQDASTQRAIANIPGVTNAQVSETYYLKFGEPGSIDFIIKHADQIAGVLTEPVQSRHPENINAPFLKQLQNCCKENNIAFILDEIITGFRIGNSGAKEWFDLDPDIVTYGKVVGGGLPIGVVAGKRKFLDYIDGGEWHFNNESIPSSPTTFVAGTFCSHPLTMAASKATLSYLALHNNFIQADLNRKTEIFCDRINSFCQRRGYPVRLAHFGSQFRFTISGKNRFLFPSLLKEKIYLWEGKNCFLSTAHGEAELEYLENRFRKCLVEHCASGFLRAEKKPIPESNARYLYSELTIENELDQDKLALAFNYVMEYASDVLSKPISFIIYHGSEPADQPTGSFVLRSRSEAGVTRFQLRTDQEIFDGWTTTALLRTLGKTYQALADLKPLPPDPFKDCLLIEKELQVVKKAEITGGWCEAENITAFLPSGSFCIEPSSLFDTLLSRFASAMGNNKITIGVPVSGQVIFRRLNAIGNYTAHLPISLDCSQTDDEMKISINDQLATGKRDFSLWYTGEKHFDHQVVFNLDNLLHNFRFGDLSLRFNRFIDKHSRYPLVCNVFADPSGIHVSMKYTKAFAEYYVQELMTKFLTGIKQYSANEYSLSK